MPNIAYTKNKNTKICNNMSDSMSLGMKNTIVAQNQLLLLLLLLLHPHPASTPPVSFHSKSIA
jgi:hypothetical protein